MSSSAAPNWDAWREGILRCIQPERTALAVIDLQVDFCSTEGALAAMGSDVSPSMAVVQRITDFLSQARGLVAMTAFFQLVYDPPKMSEAQRERLLQNGRPRLCAPNSHGVDLCITPQPGDLVFAKHRYSALTSEDFRTALERRGIDTIAVAGVDTHICVESTVRSAYDFGFRALVLGDLVATRKSELHRHEKSLEVCDRYFGLVVDSALFLRCLTSRGRR